MADHTIGAASERQLFKVRAMAKAAGSRMNELDVQDLRAVTVGYELLNQDAFTLAAQWVIHQTGSRHNLRAE